MVFDVRLDPHRPHWPLNWARPGAQLCCLGAGNGRFIAAGRSWARICVHSIRPAAINLIPCSICFLCVSFGGFVRGDRREERGSGREFLGESDLATYRWGAAGLSGKIFNLGGRGSGKVVL